MNSKVLFVFVVFALVAGVAGCEPPEPEPFDCALAWVDDMGEIQALEAGQDVPMVYGFQGFLLFEVVATSPDPPDEVEVDMRITVDVGEAYGWEVPRVGFEAHGSWVWVSEILQVFLDEAAGPESYVGSEAEVVMRLEGENRFCVPQTHVVLVE